MAATRACSGGAVFSGSEYTQGMRTACDAFRVRNSPRFDEVFFEIEKQSYPKLCPLVVLFLFFALLGLSLDVMLDPERQPCEK